MAKETKKDKISELEGLENALNFNIAMQNIMKKPKKEVMDEIAKEKEERKKKKNNNDDKK